MKRSERFRVCADVELNICMECKVCNQQFWSMWSYSTFGELKAAIAEHEEECKEPNATESKSTSQGRQPYPFNLC
jgi:hypothetical protein